MVNQQLLDYIKEQLEKGARESDVKSILLEYGWQDTDIDQGFSIVRPNNASVMAQIEKLEEANRKSGRLIRVLIVTFLLVISLLVVAAGVYWLVKNKNIEAEALQNKKAQNDIVKNEKVDIIDTKVEVPVTAPETTSATSTLTTTTTITTLPAPISTSTNPLVIKCGQIEIGTPELVKTAMKKCFQDNLKTCTSAQIIITKDVGQLGGTVTSYYETIKPNADLCSVMVRFLQNPNAEWNNKEMYCDYSKTKDFEISFADITSCKGSLYELMAKGL